jgi:hypothetical protein
MGHWEVIDIGGKIILKRILEIYDRWYGLSRFNSGQRRVGVLVNMVMSLRGP